MPSKLAVGQYPTVGTHVRIRRPLPVGVGWFWHHGVYLGWKQVIHFHGKVHKLDASIQRTSLDKFLNGDAPEYCELIKYEKCLAKEAIVQRAKSLLYVAEGGCDEEKVGPLTIGELQKLIRYSLP